jgi:hypothetical protein
MDRDPTIGNILWLGCLESGRPPRVDQGDRRGVAVEKDPGARLLLELVMLRVVRQRTSAFSSRQLESERIHPSRVKLR